MNAFVLCNTWNYEAFIGVPDCLLFFGRADV
jgi:hypothetical protein